MAIDQDSLTLEQAGLRIIEPETYSDEIRVREICTLLRENEPIHYVDNPDYPPLWVLTRHADVTEIESHHNEWLQGRNPFLAGRRQMRQAALNRPALNGRMLIHMDGQEHDDLRKLTAAWFSPRNLTKIIDGIKEYARRVVDQMETAGGECDFAEIACYYPLSVILSILGVPEEDYEYVLDMAGGRLGSRALEDSDEAQARQRERLASSSDYFRKLSAERRANPTDDLATVIATAPEPAARWLGDGEVVGYDRILAIAGHDSTTSAIVGGMHALASFPEQFARLRKDPELYVTAADEFIRWSTPVKHFTRTAVTRYTLHDQQFEVGDRVFMSYVAANQDPTVFDDPFDFDVSRSPNPHLSLGFGAHYCLGAQLSRIEIHALLNELVPRVRSIEIAGDTPLRPSYVIGGFQSLPIRYEMA